MHHAVDPTLDLSVVVPIYNERGNVAPLVDDIVAVMDKLQRSYEIILVNDGSTDGSTDVLNEVADGRSVVKVLHFAGNRGQTIALAAGMYYASGKVLISMDGDRQNDPADIPLLLDKLDEGFDCVSGWRKDRQDTGLLRFVSRLANRLVQHVTHVPVHDLGCTLKVYRRGALDPTELYGEMHRFIACYVQARGGRIAELVVRHHPRTSGQSKYGFSRTARVIADLLLIRVLHKYRTRPSHLLAKAAQYFAIGCGAFGLWWAADAIYYGSIHHGVLPFVSAVVLASAAVLSLMCGIVCELTVRSRYALSGAHPWVLAGKVNFDNES